MPNRLADASSPYLLQHKDNPVDWYEWGRDALDLAARRDVPIFLSVGYSACHWCHVMAHESFEDPETAEIMNRHFVNIKVDREERPDIDRIYMDAVQAMTGQGGWPMSVFLTPDGKPIFAGTYYPPADVGNRPSFRRVLHAVADAWSNRRDEVDEQARRLTSAVRREIAPMAGSLPDDTVKRAVDGLLASVDPVNGGFGGAPKFPQAPNLELLLRRLAGEVRSPEESALRAALSATLDRMADGGIYDHVGGGFARYAVDQIWLVPHFEKMLYDNALLAHTYLRAGQVLGSERYLAVARHTLDYLIRDMQEPDGGFHAAEDADSEGVEGKFYVWSEREFREVVGDDADVMASLYGVTPEGNFEGANILHVSQRLEDLADRHGMSLTELSQRRAAADAALLERRSERVAPGRDDKVITAWNGLAVRTLAEAGAVLSSGRYLEAARAAARFCLTTHVTDGGRLLRSTRRGSGTVLGFCDDYGSLINGLITVYEATGEREWIDAARSLAADMIDLFGDPDGRGFRAAGRDAERLIDNPRNYMDNPTPSDNSLAAEALQRLHALTGEAELRRPVDQVFAAAGKLLTEYPAAVGHLLSVLMVDRPTELAIVGEGDTAAELRSVVWEDFRPGLVLAPGDGRTAVVPLLEGRDPGNGGRAFVCEDFVCSLPVTTADGLRQQLAP